ncbi:MAG: MATE family efflux transporter [Pseudomonadota bacterium]|nr:MAG: MATE family efflux transporter [Pseudomonadota bacterium]
MARRFALRSPHDRAILGLAVPALGSLAIDPLVSLVDSVFVGRLGPAPLGALAIDGAIFSLAFVGFNFLAYGTTPRVGRALGRGDREEAGRIVVQAMGLAALAGFFVTLFLLGMARPLLALMGAKEELEAPALTYLRIRALAGPAVLLATAAHGAFRGYRDTRTPFWVALGVNLVNLVLDPLLIFGLGWGVAGAAWATVVAQWTGAVAFLWLLFVSRREAMGIPRVWPRLREMLPLLRVGGHMLMRTGALLGTMAFSTATAARMGVAVVAGHQIALQFWYFLALVLDTLAIAAQALVAHELGRGDRATARALGDRLLQWGLGLGVALGIGLALLSGFLPQLFTADPDTLRAARAAIFFVACLQPLAGLVFVWDGIYIGAEAFRYLAWAMVASAASAGLVLVVVGAHGFGIAGVWAGIGTLMTVRALTSGWPWWRGRVVGEAAPPIASG